MKFSTLSTGIGALLLSASGWLAQAQVLTPVSPVHTDSGMVTGKVLPSGVKAWLGVPFAKPPVRDLRWAAPQPVQATGVGTRWTRARGAGARRVGPSARAPQLSSVNCVQAVVTRPPRSSISMVPSQPGAMA